MKFFLRHFAESLLGQLRSWRNWLLILLLPAMTAGLLGIPQEELTAPIQVGVVLPEGRGQAFWDALSGRSDAVVSFVLCQEDRLLSRVSTGRWDCGLVLAADFEEKLARRDTDGIITFYTGPGSTVYPVVQETVCAVILELVSPELALHYMDENGIPSLFPPETLAQEQRVLVSLQTRTNQTLEAGGLARQQLRSVLLGCLGLVLLLWALFGAVDLGKWLEHAAVRRMAMLRSRSSLVLSRGLAMLCMSALGAGAALCLLPQRGTAAGALVPYLLSIWLLAMVLSRWKALWSALPCLMSAMVLISLLTSPIIFDLSGLHPALDAVMDWLPLTQFLRAAAGDTGALLRSWSLCGILSAAILLPERKGKTRACR